jgi:hypothetical protein
MNKQKKLPLLDGQLATELKTITVMISLYCRANHKSSIPCTTCQALINHAEQKLDRCVYGSQKPACKQCPIHCYKPEYREQIKIIMKESGMKIAYLHPILAFKHLLKGFNKFPNPIPDGLSNYHLRKRQQVNNNKNQG